MILTYWEIQKTIDLIEQEQIRLVNTTSPSEAEVSGPRSAIDALHNYDGTQTLSDLQNEQGGATLTPESKRLEDYKEKLEGLMSELTFDLSRRDGKVSTIT